MISSVLALVAAAAAAQASDTTRTAREAFTACLRTFADRSSAAGMSLADFTTQYPQQCTTQETAYRDAIIRRDTAMRATRASAQEAADLEVEDARFNFRDRFEASLPPQQAQAQPAAQPAAQAQAQPPAQPAAQPQ